MPSEKWKKIKWRGKLNMFWYGDTFSVRKKDAMLVAFSISTLRSRVKELRTLETDRQLS